MIHFVIKSSKKKYQSGLLKIGEKEWATAFMITPKLLTR